MTHIDDILKNYKVDLNNEENLSDLPETNPKIISFYAEKGGVGKTTTCLGLAYTFAREGKRVLIYDCDVQRSLTAWAFGVNIKLDHSNSVNVVDHFIKHPFESARPENFKLSLYEQVADNGPFAIPAFALKVKENLYIVPGSRSLPELDTMIINSETISNSNTFGYFPNQKSGKGYYCIMSTARHYKVDYVFLDLNPYPGVLNRCLLMTSHYIIIPTCLDFFCLEMMHMMSNNLRSWSAILNKQKVREGTKFTGGFYPWPNHSSKFLGYILNMFMVNNNLKANDSSETDFSKLRLRNNQKYLAEKTQEEAEKITDLLGDQRVAKMAITSLQYKACKINQKLGHVTEFYGLADLADLFHIPVPFLTEQNFIKNVGEDLFEKLGREEIKKKVEQVNRFKNMYDQIMQNIITLIEYDSEIQR